jgi:hypothetical protein
MFFRLDYLSCFLTVVATILVGRRMWSGLAVSCVNSLIVCVIGLHTAQYGFIPANLFCICINAFNLRTWLREQNDSAATSSGEGMGVGICAERAVGVLKSLMLRSGVRNEALSIR